ncbi:MAG: response regulator transcription factor [Actinomycetota bacterium]|nr:response regulator transcription factor [Actinomycetota bacterium]
MYRRGELSGPLSNQAIDVMLVDSRPVVREGLCVVIGHEPDLVVVAQAATIRDAGSLDVEPDVIVTDIDLPDAKRGDVISGLRGFFQHSSILVFTPIGDPSEVRSVLAAGANGYLLETAPTTDLLTGIRAVADGRTFLQPALGVELARWHRPRDTTLGLLPREEQVLKLLALGHTNLEVARLCSVSLRTIESHRAQIHRKLGVRTRAELVQFARDAGLVDPQ